MCSKPLRLSCVTHCLTEVLLHNVNNLLNHCDTGLHCTCSSFAVVVTSIWNAHRYMVEHRCVGAEPFVPQHRVKNPFEICGGVKVHCRDNWFGQSGGRRFELDDDIPNGAASIMVTTRHSIKENLQLWGTQLPRLQNSAGFCCGFSVTNTTNTSS